MDHLSQNQLNMIEDLDPVHVEDPGLSHILDVDQYLRMKGLKTGGLDLNISGNLGPSLTTTSLVTLTVLIIVAFLENATIGYSLESVCVCVCVCVFA